MKNRRTYRQASVTDYCSLLDFVTLNETITKLYFLSDFYWISTSLLIRVYDFTCFGNAEKVVKARSGVRTRCNNDRKPCVILVSIPPSWRQMESLKSHVPSSYMSGMYKLRSGTPFVLAVIMFPHGHLSTYKMCTLNHRYRSNIFKASSSRLGNSISFLHPVSIIENFHIHLRWNWIFRIVEKILSTIRQVILCVV